jgi:hypothetical protein
MTSVKTDPDTTAVPTPAAPTSLEGLKTSLDELREHLTSASERSASYVDLYLHCTDLINAAEKKIRELAPSAEITPEQLDSVCVLLGPFRNLTTLTGAVLGLHPQCSVLNHAGLRILPNPRLNFLADDSPDVFRAFVRYAGFLSRAGGGGPYGGDIRFSHAFDFKPMQQAAARLDDLGRRQTTCLVWKDSQRVTNFLRSARIDVPRLLARNEKLRFLLPVRNPIDCAISNLRTGHFQFLTSRQLSATSPLEDVVAAVLDEIAWFVALREGSGMPERFFLYFEHEMGREVLEKMLDFLSLPREEAYLAAVADAFRIGRPRRKEKRIVDAYAEQVSHKFERNRPMREALLEFAKPSER